MSNKDGPGEVAASRGPDQEEKLLIATESSAPAHPTATEKTPRPCAGCGEPSGSISAGTGFPVVRERATGLYYHVRCRPGTPSGAAAGILAGVL